MSEKYELHGFADLLKLTDKQVERFAAELPAMVEQVRAVMATVELCADALGIDTEQELMKLCSPLTWIDDGKRDNAIRFIGDDEPIGELKITTKEH